MSDIERASFDLLHEKVQRWIWNRGWPGLRDIQQESIAAVLSDASDIIISAATASGKTEAAFLPICSRLVTENAGQGIRAVYVGPLKALINDQWSRLDELCEQLDIPVHRWHGDVSSSAKQRLLRNPCGILLITPESLEAIFVRHGSDVARLFAETHDVVVDELHSFIGAERGMQLLSLLHRLDFALKRRVRRIGLSATLGDNRVAADFLRAYDDQRDVRMITSAGGDQEVLLQVRGYRQRPPREEDRQPEEEEESVRSIAAHLFRTLRGSNNLIFANRRQVVEWLADLLARISEAERVPLEFYAHHGSLSRELRTDVEAMLKDGTRPTTAVCTSTLEMGIDIGAVKSVAQIGPPPSVAAMRQRLGRSGRRGSPPVLRAYIREQEIDARTPPHFTLHPSLVQTIAMVELLLEPWNEPNDVATMHPSTFVQQLMSLIAQHGGIYPDRAWHLLCAAGPFRRIDAAAFERIVTGLVVHKIIERAISGLLLLGAEGERLVGHYTFYTAFITSEEYRLVSDGRTLGTLPVRTPLSPGSFLIFGGRRWCVTAVDERQHVIDLAPSKGGRLPPFEGHGFGDVDDRVRATMLAIYRATAPCTFCDPVAAGLLAEGRDNFRRLGLDENCVIPHGTDTLLFPWCGDRVMNTIVRALGARGVKASAEEVAILVDDVSPVDTMAYLAAIAADESLDPHTLAATVSNKQEDKYDGYVDDETLNAAYAARRLDVPRARAVLTRMIGEFDENCRRSVAAVSNGSNKVQPV
jgi:ATP-dependent Lhr-like helicase